jgi:hypothetical protein
VALGDHDQSKTIVDALVSAFQREVIDRERTERLARCDMVEKKLNSLKSQVLDKERQLYNLSQQIGTADGQTAKVQYKMQVDALDTLMRSRTDIQRQVSDLDLKFALAKFLKDASDKNSVPEDEIESVVFKDPQMQHAMNELAGLERDQAEIEKAVKKPTDPAATRIRDHIKALKKSVDEMKIAATLQVKDQLKRNGEGSGAATQHSLVERQLLEAQYKQITEQIIMQAKAIQNLEKFDGEAEQLREDIDQLRGIVKDMGGALTKLKIELDAEPRVSIVEQGN